MTALAIQTPMTLLPTAKPSKAVMVDRHIQDKLTPTKRQQISAFKTVLDCLLHLSVEKESLNQRVAAFQSTYQAHNLPIDVLDALKVLQGKKAGQCPNRATLFRWIADLERYQNGNTEALTKKYKGRQRTVYGWEQKAIELFNRPQKPGYADVAFWLRTDHGFDSATKDRVTRYLQTMPATLGKQSPERVGKNFYKHNLSPYKIRDNDVLPVGFGYEGDGHTIDVYVAHPVTGKLYRPELTTWIDVRSNFIVGWYLTDDESAISTLYALSEAILNHDHVPAMLFLDNGSGFKARMMNDDVSGFYNRLDITPSYSLPGNSKGKGLVEGFHKIFRNRHDKKFITYCGDDMAPEINRRLSSELEQGKRQLPAFAEYYASVKKFIDDFNYEPKESLKGKTPREVWNEELQQVHVHIEADALVRPREIRTVRKWRIRLDNRYYEHAALAQYNGEEVMVEFSLHHDAEIRVLNDKEQLICVAQLVSKVARLPESRIVEAQEKRLKGQEKRLNNKLIEVQNRSKPILTMEDNTSALEDLTADFDLIESDESFNESYLDLGLEDERTAVQSSSLLDWMP